MATKERKARTPKTPEEKIAELQAEIEKQLAKADAIANREINAKKARRDQLSPRLTKIASEYISLEADILADQGLNEAEIKAQLVGQFEELVVSVIE